MRPQKSLGQYFLTSRAVARDIVSAADLSKDEVVLEVGPGTGMLTKALLPYTRKVIAVEKDTELIRHLRKILAQEISEGRLVLVNDDIRNFSAPEERLWKIVANIPYYITGDIIRRFLSASAQPERIVLLVQKEVAFRIARSKKESVLSISVKAYGTPRYVKTIGARHFKPRPKVDSAILAIEDISRDFFKDIDEIAFFTLVKAGFAHKRKLLVNNIRHLFKKETPEHALDACDIPQKARAEDLALEQWKKIFRAMSP